MVTVNAASHLNDASTLVFFVGALLFLGLTALAGLRDSWGLSRQRVVYWSGTAGAALCAFLAGLPDDWSGGLIFAFLIVVVMTMNAYFLGSFIKLGGRVRALHFGDEQAESEGPVSVPPGAYGFISAPRLWWMLVVGTAICSVNVADSVLGSGERKPLLALALLGVFVFIAIGLGYGDGATGNAIARRQIVQFVIIGLISLAVFTVVYLLTYSVGRSGFRQNEDPTESPSRHAKP